MSDMKAGYPRVAPPPDHIPGPPRPWSEVAPMGPEQAVRCEGCAQDSLYETYERLLREEQARYRRHMVYAGCLIGLCLGYATAEFIKWLLP